jgi:hypothetical protein
VSGLRKNMGGPLRRESESVLSEIRELPPETLLSRYPLPVSSRLFTAEVITHEDDYSLDTNIPFV